MFKSLADDYIETGLACIVWQMGATDMQELRYKNLEAYDNAMLELGYRRSAEAKMNYFDNHKRGKLKFYNFIHIPCPFFYDDGRVEWNTVPHHPYTVIRHEKIGTPRWCEWGCDIKNVEIKYINFKRAERAFFSHEYAKRVYAYIENFTPENEEKVKKYACSLMFSMSRNKIK